MKKLVKAIVAIIAVAAMLTMTACGASFDANKKVTVVTRGDGSGTKSAFMEIIGLKGKKDISGAIIAADTAAVLVEVKGNPHAIAFDSLGYVTDEVKKLKVNGVEATVENIKNGSYKISRPLSVVYKEGNMTGVNKAFYDFLLSKNAQEIISANGYVTNVENPADYVKTDLSGSVAISGSTSFYPLMTELTKAFENIEKSITVTVKGGGSGTGYKDAENGISAFGMISEAFTQSKAASCTYHTAALDGIAVIVNKANTMESITMEQLKNIYDLDAGANAVKTWKQLGV